MNRCTQPVAVVAGGSGFIGRHLIAALTDDGYAVRRIGRNQAVRWSDARAMRHAVDGAALVVNLAGRSVDCRYTARNRHEILDSRTATTSALREAIRTADAPPRVWLNASTATIYRHSTERPNAEVDGVIGEGFSVDVATSWERELFEGDLPHTRRVALRMAIVLGDGPAAQRLLLLARLGLGGAHHDGWAPPHRRYRGIGTHPTGSDRAPWYRTHGRQRFSWIHIDDVIAAMRFLRDNDELSGPVNLTSPNPSDDRTLMRTLRRVVGAPFGLPSNRWMIDAAMAVLRTEPELILKSRWVLPEKLLDAGFSFRHPDLEEALRDVSRRTRSAR
ncbi:epimerase [Microbacterium sp. CJ88]|uniref:epimerase n=1 Tax=Microbacterium sp. CJ88 TaxID=3445672 RepID=UPI003F65E325